MSRKRTPNTWRSASSGLTWSQEISNRAAKERVAAQMADRLNDGDVVGVGSGSTSFLTLQALAERAEAKRLDFIAIPTSGEVELACAALGVRTTTLPVARPSWSFDGADEVDPAGNMIKGRGGALLREKVLMAASPERFIVVDESKLVSRLGTRFPVPVELVPDAVALVQDEVARWSLVTECRLRLGVAKDGPVITERGNYLLDVRFSDVTPATDGRLRKIPGVVATGLFIGFRPTVLVAR